MQLETEGLRCQQGDFVFVFSTLIVREFLGTSLRKDRVQSKCSVYVEHGKSTGEAVCVSVTDILVADPGESPSNDTPQYYAVL